jgi:hypothetical protein
LGFWKIKEPSISFFFNEGNKEFVQFQFFQISNMRGIYETSYLLARKQAKNLMVFKSQELGH